MTACPIYSFILAYLTPGINDSVIYFTKSDVFAFARIKGQRSNINRRIITKKLMIFLKIHKQDIRPNLVLYLHCK